MSFRAVIGKIKKFGLVIWLGGWRELLPTLRSYLPYLGRIKNYRPYFDRLQGKSGLEIGGPTKLFQKSGILPIYPIIRSLDGCNFAERTIWEGELTAGETYLFDRHKPKGHQYLTDAVSLKDITDEKYDFILSSHCLEHIANPLKALREWLRVLKRNGALLLVLPAKKKNFDRKRQVTKLRHLLADYNNNVGEDDTTHLAEVIALHDRSLDSGLPGRNPLQGQSIDNLQNRALHHHVFSKELLEDIYEYFKLRILAVDFSEPGHIIILGQKP